MKQLILMELNEIFNLFPENISSNIELNDFMRDVCLIYGLNPFISDTFKNNEQINIILDSLNPEASLIHDDDEQSTNSLKLNYHNLIESIHQYDDLLLLIYRTVNPDTNKILNNFMNCNVNGKHYDKGETYHNVSFKCMLQTDFFSIKTLNDMRYNEVNEITKYLFLVEKIVHR